MVTARKSKSKDLAKSKLIKAIIAGLEKAHAGAKLDLNFANPLQLLIALILAAQARDDLVNQVTAALFQKYRTAADYGQAPLAELEQQVRKINFYRNKARAIHDCCAKISERHEGSVPDRLDDLLALPGVGRKTANIVLGNAFGHAAIGVDTHVLRLSQRLGLTKNSNPDKVEFDLMPLVPESRRVRFCHLLQYQGRRVCFAKKPNCPECNLRSICPYPEKTKP
ncbi:MAG: endonuclease III [Deltaproteobacteria bacterium]|nr:endonuclease III [Deltaproteobacteria bacterium]